MIPAGFRDCKVNRLDIVSGQAWRAEGLQLSSSDEACRLYLKGLYAFRLVETNFYDQAERYAKEALMLAPGNAWSVHTMAHVHEMRAETDCKGSDMLASHNYWHWALHHIEKESVYFSVVLHCCPRGEYEAALRTYDSEVSRRCVSSGTMLPIVDCCSMLYWLEMEEVAVKDQWRELFQVTKSHTEDHVLLFNDLHFLMVSLGAGEEGASHRLLETLQELDTGENHTLQLALPIGVPTCQALVEYPQPIRYRIHAIGGSNVQRDLFNQLLLHAAMSSEKRQHRSLARCLLSEREAAQPNSQLTQRLILRSSALPVQ